jgi:hypothetical protein
LDHHLDIRTRKNITQEQVNELIGYIVDDKMNVKAASKKANKGKTTGSRYYRNYLKSQKRNGSD